MMHKVSLLLLFGAAILVSGNISFIEASSERILQQEQMSYETCMEVIKLSADKLLIEPDIVNVEPEKSIASFKLLDGIMKISCNGVAGIMTVSTNS